MLNTIKLFKIQFKAKRLMDNTINKIILTRVKLSKIEFKVNRQIHKIFNKLI